MSNTLQAYKAVEYNLPEEARTWQLSAAGFENLELTQGPRRKPGPDEIAFRTDVNSICFSDVKIISAGEKHPRLVGVQHRRGESRSGS